MWTKLAQDGLNGGSWAVDKLIANKVCFPIQALSRALADPNIKKIKGRHGLTIPSNLKAGDYLIRAEIIGRFPSRSLRFVL